MTLAGEMVPMDGTAAGAGKLGFTLRLPVGIIAAITPFNFPLNLVAHKIAPALAAGCAVVLKPAEKTPMSALFLAGLLMEAGLPAGWLNVVVGEPEPIAGVMLSDERVRLVTFTGSAAIGWRLRERAGARRVTLELGNSTPVIVAADADLELVAAKIAATAYAFSGQSCISIQRVLVHRDVADELLAKLQPRVEALTVGDPADPATDVGPLITQAAADRVRGLIDAAVAAGARLVTGGGGTGTLIAPAILCDVTPSMDVFASEVFGPLIAMTAFADLDEAIALANATEYGLQAAIFTRDLASALRAARELRFGGVMINETPTFRADQMPYGGTKRSGDGKEGPASAVREMTEERLVVIDA
jgi:acyl-CoA reductase-like NAD-dependent aldehyde dehydrogenase